MGGQSYLLFVWTPAGYELQERKGEVPPVGARVELEGREERVVKVGPSPLPGDGRPCAFLGG